MIRQATLKDLPQLHRMGRRFHEVSGYAEVSEYDPESVDPVFRGMIETGTLFTDGQSGFLGFIVFPIFFDNSVTAAQELFWWVDENARSTKLGVELLDAYEKRAKEMGASVVMAGSLSALDSVKVNHLYLKRGYKSLDTSYMRSI